MWVVRARVCVLQVTSHHWHSEAWMDGTTECIAELNGCCRTTAAVFVLQRWRRLLLSSVTNARILTSIFVSNFTLLFQSIYKRISTKGWKNDTGCLSLVEHLKGMDKSAEMLVGKFQGFTLGTR